MATNEVWLLSSGAVAWRPGLTSPLITVGMPVYNGAAYIEESIASILDQSFTDIELVISDNGSTDSTVDVVERLAAMDRRIKLFRSAENNGAAWNFNRVVELSSGKYFKWAGHDDVILPGYFEVLLDAYEAASPGTVLCYTTSFLIDDEGERTKAYDDGMNLVDESPSQRLHQFFHNLRLVNFLFGLWDAETLKGTRGLGAYPTADTVMLAELVMAGKFVECPDRLFLRRRHDEASWKATGKYEGFADWFDPTRRHLLVFPSWRLTKELMAAVDLADVTSSEKRLLRQVVFRDYFLRRRGALVREVLRAPGALTARLVGPRDKA